MGVGTPPPDGEERCSWGKYTDGAIAGCLMKPQYKVPLTCWRHGDLSGDRVLKRAALKGEELGEWKHFCPTHAATVSNVLMAEQGHEFGRLLDDLYKEAGQDLGKEVVLATVETQGRLLDGFFLEAKEKVHYTDGGMAALFYHSCLTIVCSEWSDRIQRCEAELLEARGELDCAEGRLGLSNEFGSECRSMLGHETEAHAAAVEALRDLEADLHAAETREIAVADSGTTTELEMQIRLIECTRAMEETATEYKDQENELIRSYNDIDGLEEVLAAVRRTEEATLQTMENLEDQEAKRRSVR